jgi:hypothetical protein
MLLVCTSVLLYLLPLAPQLTPPFLSLVRPCLLFGISLGQPLPVFLPCSVLPEAKPLSSWTVLVSVTVFLINQLACDFKAGNISSRHAVPGTQWPLICCVSTEHSSPTAVTTGTSAGTPFETGSTALLQNDL